jgi:hypothetical protein
MLTQGRRGSAGREMGGGVGRGRGMGAGVPGSVGEDGFVGEDAVEGGAADLKLAGGAEFVATVEFEDVLDVVADDGVEGEIVGLGGGLGDQGRGFLAVGEVEVVGADDAVNGFEQSGFEDGGQFADIARPAVLQEAGERAGAEDDGALLVADADAVKQGLGERGNILAAHAQRGDGEADGAEAEGEVGQEQALAGHLAERGLRGCEDDGAAGRAVLHGFEDAEEQTLAGRGEQIDAVEIGKAGEGVGVGVGDQPLAGVSALEAGAGGERLKR